jgi:hypothetical protein
MCHPVDRYVAHKKTENLMADLTDILRLEDKVLEFARDIEVLGSLEIVVDTFREKRSEIVGLGVSDIFDFITSIEEDQDFFNALSGLGLDAANMNKWRARTPGSSTGRFSMSGRVGKLLLPIRSTSVRNRPWPSKRATHGHDPTRTCPILCCG